MIQIPLVLIFSFLAGGLCEGATQNFSVSLASLSPNPLLLQSYGSMETYVAYMADSSSDASAWLLFIPHPASSNASYILASYVFAQGSLVNEGAIVWMANRNHPVSGNFSLTLNQTSGNLVLLDGDGSVAWFSNNSYTPNGPVSMDLKTSGLLPIGTLVLSDASNITIWQSSDHPTDTLIPPQFFQPGMNLISWASPSDPSDGLFRLAMEAGGLALYYKNSLPYWVWSYYGRNDSFGVTHTCRNLTNAFMSPDGAIILGVTNLPSLDSTSTDLCPADYTTLHGEVEFEGYGQRGNDVIFLQLQHDGNLVANVLGPTWDTFYDLFAENRCLLPNYCGPYGVCTAPANCQCPPSSDGSFPGVFPSDHSQGCPPTHSFSCRSASDLKLMPMSGVDYFANKYSSPLTNLSTQDLCQDACLQNCSCLAAFWHAHTSSCFHASDMMSLQGSLNSSYMAFVKVERLPESKLNLGLIAGLVSGVAALLIVVILAATIICRKRRANLESEGDEEEDPFWKSVPGLPRRYTYKDLESFTKGFSEKMGKGGFGAVYAGVLQDGTKVAVKRLESLRQGKKEFRAEVVILGGVHHYNLVGLVGFCAEGTHRLLVYEYMANGSLDQWLFVRDKAPLEWKHRFNIALGAARGLAYLHGECKDTIVHLDIKPENILLDEDFVAKVADFGLATLMSRNETHVITTMRGTPGYLAPEWIAEGFQISAKCDVFSFGKLLMEILGERRNLEPSLSQETDKPYFPSWLYLHTTHQGKEADLTHIARVKTSEEMRQARLMMKTAFLCVLENPAQRPSMEKVVHMLEGRAPELEDLDLSELFQGLQFALRMPSPSLAHSRIEEALAPLYRTLSLEFVSSHIEVASSSVSASKGLTVVERKNIRAFGMLYEKQ